MESNKNEYNEPQHYQINGINVITFINGVIDECNNLKHSQAFYIANALKYIIRAEKKNGKDDYLKAIDYLKRLVDTL